MGDVPLDALVQRGVSRHRMLRVPRSIQIRHRFLANPARLEPGGAIDSCTQDVGIVIGSPVDQEEWLLSERSGGV
jgi:hypothetical protein